MKLQYLLKIYFITMVLGLWLSAKADFFTAIAHIEPLLYTHNKIIDNLEDYIANEEQRLVFLKKHLNHYKEEYILASEDISDYLQNPINAFTLIKRLTLDLDFLHNSILVNSDYVENIITNIPHVKYPAFEDLMGAIQGLTRLQETYLLDIVELADGRLVERNSRGSKDTAITTPMTASDCYVIGKALYADEDYHKALLWMMESLRKIASGDDLFNIKKVDVMENVILSHYRLDDIKTAIEWSKKLLMLYPRHPNVSHNVKVFKKLLDENASENKRNGETSEDKDDNDYEGDQQRQIIKIYKALCRGDVEIPREMQKRLKCSYMTKNHPFLKLAPIKMEQIYIGPDVFLFHEVISDEEIVHIKNVAYPKINRAEITDPNSGISVTVPYRISKATWLRSNEHKVVERITQRTSDFTGFSMDTAEDLLVANYGIGGHYEPHFDFDQEYDLFEPAGNDRLATVLFYMSDVAQGGATVFTELGLTVFPIKNSALFWLNLLPSGEGDVATRHGACPVLRGSKWASNKWIHNIGQELIRPCSRED